MNDERIRDNNWIMYDPDEYIVVVTSRNVLMTHANIVCVEKEQTVEGM